MNFNLTMSSTAGMRKARVLPLPVFAAARRSLSGKRGKEETSGYSFSRCLNSQHAQSQVFQAPRLEQDQERQSSSFFFLITEFNHLSKTPNSEVRLVPRNRSEHLQTPGSNLKPLMQVGYVNQHNANKKNTLVAPGHKLSWQTPSTTNRF